MATPQEPAERDARLFGALRHVQLLEVTEEEPRTMRFATATHRGVALFERRIDDGDLLGEPVAFLETGYSVIPVFTWTRRVPWRVLDSDGDVWLVARDPKAEALVVQRFQTGERVAEIEDVAAFEDARVTGGEIQILARRGESIVFATVDLESGELGCRVLLDAESRFAGACFLASSPGATPLDLAFVATFEEHTPVVERVDLATGESLRFPTSAIERLKTTLRVAARRDGEVDRVAVGLPKHRKGWGRVESVEISVSETRWLATTFWPFDRSSEDAPDGEHWYSNYGQAVGFTADADGDDRPDLVVGASYGGFTEHVDLLSLVKARRIRDFGSTTSMHRIGSSVSVSPCGHYVLAAGGYVTYPEDLESSGVASLIGVMDRGVRLSTFHSHRDR